MVMAMGTVITFCNHKGGVGKTTLSVLFAVYQSAVRKDPKRVLVVDMDGQGNASAILTRRCRGLKQEPDIIPFSGNAVKDLFNADLEHVAPMRATYGIDLLYAEPDDDDVYALNNCTDESLVLRFIAALQSLRANYDYIVLDPPPQNNFMEKVAIFVADHVVAPIVATSISSLYGTRSIMDRLSNADIAERLLGVLFYMIPERPTRVTKNKLDTLRASLGDLALNHTVSSRQVVTNAQDINLSLWSYPGSRTAATEYECVFTELEKRIRKRAGGKL